MAEGIMNQTFCKIRAVARTATMTAAVLGTSLGLVATAAAAAPATAELSDLKYDEYVALGDSYASGAGLARQKDVNCDRTDNSYPSMLQTSLKAKTFKDATCGGATTSEMRLARSTNPAQFDSLSAGTDLVTLTVGGNDIGFAEIITNCVIIGYSDPAGSPCKEHYNSTGSDALTARVEATAVKVSTVLDGIRARSPKARVLVVGYPSLLPDNGESCRSALPFADGDFAYLRDVTRKLNKALAAKAQNGSYEYVDTYTPTVGHDMCQGSGKRWIEPLDTTMAAAHPNALGQFITHLGVISELTGQS